MNLLLAIACLSLAPAPGPSAGPGKRDPNPWIQQEIEAGDQLAKREFPDVVVDGRAQNLYVTAALKLIGSDDDARAQAGIDFLKHWFARLRDPAVRVYQNADEREDASWRQLPPLAIYEPLFKCAKECDPKRKAKARKAIDALALKDPLEFPGDSWWILAPFFGEIPMAQQIASYPTDMLFTDELAVRGDMVVLFGEPRNAKGSGVVKVLGAKDGRVLNDEVLANGAHISGGAVTEKKAYIQRDDGAIDKVDLAGNVPTNEFSQRMYPTSAWTFDPGTGEVYFAGPGLRVWHISAGEMTRLCGERSMQSIACVASVKSLDGFAIVYESNVIDPASNSKVEFVKAIGTDCNVVWTFPGVTSSTKDQLALVSASERMFLADAEFLRLLNAADGSEISNVRHGAQGVTALAISPDERFVLCEGFHWSIQLRDSKTLKVLYSYSGHHGGGVKVAWSPDSASFFSIATDGVLRQWSVPKQILQAK